MSYRCPIPREWRLHPHLRRFPCRLSLPFATAMRLELHWELFRRFGICLIADAFVGHRNRDILEPLAVFRIIVAKCARCLIRRGKKWEEEEVVMKTISYLFPELDLART
jgi:hypothetical protein